jgi:hypothetical protein
MGRLDRRAGLRTRLQVNSLEDRCVPSAVVSDPKWVESININDGATVWEAVYSIEITFTQPLSVRPDQALHLYESQMDGLIWTEIEIPNVESWLNEAGNTVMRCIGPSAGDAIVVDGDYKIVLTPTQFSASIELGTFHGVDLGEGDGDDDGEWH